MGALEISASSLPTLPPPVGRQRSWEDLSDFTNLYLTKTGLLIEAQRNLSAAVSFGAFDGALKNAELMAGSEDLKLQCRAAPEGSENSGPESRQ